MTTTPATDTSYPNEIDVLPHIPANAKENDPGLEHDVMHARANAVLNALQALLGLEGDEAGRPTVLGRLRAVEEREGAATGTVRRSVQSGPSYTLTLGDVGAMVCMSHGDANSVVVPRSSTVEFPSGARIDISWDGTGQTSVAPGHSDVVVRSPETLKLRKRHGKATLIRRDDLGPDVWDLEGNLEAAP